MSAPPVEVEERPLLGLATTEVLFRELIARFRYDLGTERALVLAEMLGGLSAEEREYRTVSA